MTWKEQLTEYRNEIDSIDQQLLPLFQRRMDLSKKIGALKCDHNMAILDSSREDQVVKNAMDLVNRELRAEAGLLMRTIMALSREYQRKLVFTEETPIFPAPVPPKTENVVCAYQGAPGAWSEQAAASLYPNAVRKPVEQFEDAFIAVKNGTADYGIVPIENSKTGAIGETYDLLRKYGCYIVGRIWISIRQNLIGIPGTQLADVREVLSHPEGLKQCSGFLKGKHFEQTACTNTAVAAQKVAEMKDPKKAAIASARAAELNGLEILVPDIMDSADNRTCFVVIANHPEYDETSNLISLTFSTMHRSGALCEALLPFMVDDLNLMRIESRPASADKYRFFAEIQGNIMDQRVILALRQSAALSEYFEVLGCYSTSVSGGEQ